MMSSYQQLYAGAMDQCAVRPDYLTCGHCAREFLLANITLFIAHKALGCDATDKPYVDTMPPAQSLTDTSSPLTCSFCSRVFLTARGLLQHAEEDHSMRLCFKKGPLIIPDSCIHPPPAHISDNNNNNNNSNNTNSSSCRSSSSCRDANPVSSSRCAAVHDVIGQDQPTDLSMNCCNKLGKAYVECSENQCKVTIKTCPSPVQTNSNIDDMRLTQPRSALGLPKKRKFGDGQAPGSIEFISRSLQREHSSGLDFNISDPGADYITYGEGEEDSQHETDMIRNYGEGEEDSQHETDMIRSFDDASHIQVAESNISRQTTNQTMKSDNEDVKVLVTAQYEKDRLCCVSLSTEKNIERDNKRVDYNYNEDNDPNRMLKSLLKTKSDNSHCATSIASGVMNGVCDDSETTQLVYKLPSKIPPSTNFTPEPVSVDSPRAQEDCCSASCAQNVSFPPTELISSTATVPSNFIFSPSSSSSSSFSVTQASNSIPPTVASLYTHTTSQLQQEYAMNINGHLVNTQSQPQLPLFPPLAHAPSSSSWDDLQGYYPEGNRDSHIPLLPAAIPDEVIEDEFQILNVKSRVNSLSASAPISNVAPIPSSSPLIARTPPLLTPISNMAALQSSFDFDMSPVSVPPDCCVDNADYADGETATPPLLQPAPKVAAEAAEATTAAATITTSRAAAAVPAAIMTTKDGFIVSSFYDNSPSAAVAASVAMDTNLPRPVYSSASIVFPSAGDPSHYSTLTNQDSSKSSVAISMLSAGTCAYDAVGMVEAQGEASIPAPADNNVAESQTSARGRQKALGEVAAKSSLERSLIREHEGQGQDHQATATPATTDTTITHDSSTSSPTPQAEPQLVRQSKKRRYPTSRPFQCSHCDQAFNQRIHLKKHMSKHTGLKPFKCQHCDYSTVERSHLKVHFRVHTGEKPFKCAFCDYATAQNSTLKIHLKRHHHNNHNHHNRQGGGVEEGKSAYKSKANRRTNFSNNLTPEPSSPAAGKDSSPCVTKNVPVNQNRDDGSGSSLNPSLNDNTTNSNNRLRFAANHFSVAADNAPPPAMSMLDILSDVTLNTCSSISVNLSPTMTTTQGNGQETPAALSQKSHLTDLGNRS